VREHLPDWIILAIQVSREFYGLDAVSDLTKSLMKRAIVINALRISLVVGTILNAINQGPEFVRGLEIAWGQVLLNFFVPYCVASYSAAKNEVARIKSG